MGVYFADTGSMHSYRAFWQDFQLPEAGSARGGFSRLRDGGPPGPDPAPRAGNPAQRACRGKPDPPGGKPRSPGRETQGRGLVSLPSRSPAVSRQSEVHVSVNDSGRSAASRFGLKISVSDSVFLYVTQ